MSSTNDPGRDDPAAGDRANRQSRHGSQDGAQQQRHDAGGFDRDRAEREARDAIGNARDELQSMLENQKNAAAAQVRAVADALRQTEEALRDKGQNSVAAYVGHVAERIDYWSNRLRERHIDELGRDIQNLANRQPVLFIAGAVVLGFAATRFLKSTQATGDRHPAGGSLETTQAASSTASTEASQSPVRTEQASPGTQGSTTSSRSGDLASPNTSHS